MKCHYEVLELSREADDGEIKSAYRKLALRWHPDKNLDNPDLAKVQFQIVQQAYDVLSDKQERAWYDAHRDQIIRGANSEFQDKSLDVFQYFTTTCFKGYSDDNEGFYGVYRNIFDQIAKEDIEFMDEKEEFCEIPGFGRSESDSESVRAFYDYWMSYSTKKSYSWLDPNDIREGKGHRKLLKIIEKENKKSRLKAQKERNEEVRNLVAFVRKRDKRVQAFKKEQEAKTLENRKKQEQLNQQKRLERKQMHASERQADWLKFDNVKSELEEIEKHLAQEFGEELSQTDEELEEDFNNLYCVACNKIFKNPNAFENHEISKKHKENVERIRDTMLEDYLEAILSDDLDEYDDLKHNDKSLDHIIIANAGDEYLIVDEENLHEISETTRKKKLKKKTRNTFNTGIDLTDDQQVHLKNSENEDSDQDNNSSVKKSKKKKKNVLNTSQNGLTDHISEDLDVTKFSDDEFDFGLTKNQKKKNKRRNTNKSISDTINAKKKDEPTDNVNSENRGETFSKADFKKQVRKEKKRGAKDLDSLDLSEVDTKHCCVTCKGNFPSKNKLFDHLKKTGHGVYLPSKAKQSSKKNSVKL